MWESLAIDWEYKHEMHEHMHTTATDLATKSLKSPVCFLKTNNQATNYNSKNDRSYSSCSMNYCKNPPKTVHWWFDPNNLKCFALFVRNMSVCNSIILCRNSANCLLWFVAGSQFFGGFETFLSKEIGFGFVWTGHFKNIFPKTTRKRVFLIIWK